MSDSHSEESIKTCLTVDAGTQKVYRGASAPLRGARRLDKIIRVGKYFMASLARADDDVAVKVTSTALPDAAALLLVNAEPRKGVQRPLATGHPWPPSHRQAARQMLCNGESFVGSCGASGTSISGNIDSAPGGPPTRWCHASMSALARIYDLQATVGVR